jgi:hypothetical protein
MELPAAVPRLPLWGKKRKNIPPEMTADDVGATVPWDDDDKIAASKMITKIYVLALFES